MSNLHNILVDRYESLSLLSGVPVNGVASIIEYDWSEGNIWDQDSEHYKWLYGSSDLEVASWIKSVYKFNLQEFN